MMGHAVARKGCGGSLDGKDGKMAWRRLIGPMVLGIAGVAVLMSLGFWQVARMEEKRVVIEAIEARIMDAPVALPQAPEPARDRYMPVRVEGRFTGEAVHVLAAQRAAGTGIHVIAVLEKADGRRLLVDRGFLPDAAREGFSADSAEARVIGNLHWPRDADRHTPEPDLERGLWFAREVAPIAAHLGSEPMLIVARAEDPPAPALRPVPVGTEGIPDNHFEYAVTWFLLAAAWAGMTLYLLWRIRREDRA